MGKDTNPKDAIGARKAKLSVIPAGVLLDLGNALLEGAVKGYRRHNYRVAGVRSSVYYDAALGHLMDWWEGDDIDQESGLSHVTKAIASLVVLRDAMLQGMLNDDRPPRSKVFKRDFNHDAARIIDQYAHVDSPPYTIADTPTPDFSMAWPDLSQATDPEAAEVSIDAWNRLAAKLPDDALVSAARDKTLGDYIARKTRLLDNADE